MRTLHLWNRQDLRDLMRGVPFDIRVGDEVHTIQAEHAYKKAATASNGDGTPKPGNGHTTFTDKDKRAIVKRLAKERRVDIARDIGVSATTVGTWAKKFRSGG